MTTKKLEVTLPALYDRYAIHIRFRSNLEGGVPTNKEMIRSWIKARMKKAGRDIETEELETLVQETLKSVSMKAVDEVTEEVVADGLLWNTFFRSPEGNPVFEGRCLKAAFKEQANILKDVLAAEAKVQQRGQKTKKDGSDGGSNYNTMYRSKLAERLFVEELTMPFMRDGKPLTDVDGREEKAIHVITPQGPRSALKRYDFIRAGVELTFSVRILRDGVVTEHDLLRMLEHGQDNGLGSGRSQGNGRFEVLEIRELEPLESMPLFSKVVRRKVA